jgi:hypothetical protein
MKKLYSLDLNSGLLYKWQVFCHWTIKVIINVTHISILVPCRTTVLRTHSCRSLLLVWQICSLNWDLYFNSPMVQCQNTYNCCRGPGFESWVKLLTIFHADILGRLGSNLVFIVPFGTLYVEFGSEVWLVPFGIM